MIFAAPFVLVALVGLPLLWWLLRATPPAPRAQDFPAIRLLAGLKPAEQTPARTPWWLLALRITAAGLVIVGLARPVLTSGRVAVAGGGPALLVIDDGWSSAPDFAARLAAGGAVLSRLERAGRRVALLTTAPGLDGLPPRATASMPAGELRPVLAALAPKPWPVDRRRAASAVQGSGPVFYVSDGLATAQDRPFARALAGRGRVTEFAGGVPARLLRAASSPEQLTAQLRQTPSPIARTEFVLAETNDGRVLSRTPMLVPAGAPAAEAAVPLPPELRNQLGALRLADAPGAGSVALLDEAARRRPVGLVGSGTGADTPLLGDLFYLDRALAPTTELRRGDVATLLKRQLSMIVVTAGTLPAGEAAQLGDWVKHGGLLLRFAGPGMSSGEDADPLLPGRLLSGDRQLGGAMSWSQPAHLAPFPDGSPFAGLRIPAEVSVNRQVLADPSDAAPQTWARLSDGTPLVTASRIGSGEVVLFHVTANADWSNLPLSGLFVDMLGRLAQRSAGVAVIDDSRMLTPALSLDGSGVLGTPPPAARPARASDLAGMMPSPAHPPGLYGPERDRHALDLGNAAIPLTAMPAVAGAEILQLDAAPRERPVGPWAVALALALLCVDMAATLKLRGLFDGVRRPWLAAMLAAAWLPGAARAESPALATHLAYVVTGDAQVDATSRAGLAGLSDYVNGRTAAVLGEPAAVVTPGTDELSLLPR